MVALSPNRLFRSLTHNNSPHATQNPSPTLLPTKEGNKRKEKDSTLPVSSLFLLACRRKNIFTVDYQIHCISPSNHNVLLGLLHVADCLWDCTNDLETTRALMINRFNEIFLLVYDLLLIDLSFVRLILHL